MSVITDRTLADFVAEVSRQQHAMAGAVIAASAAQAAALGRACMQISREAETVTAVSQPVARMSHIQSDLLAWCDQDADAIAEYVALRDAGEPLAGQRLLCRAPATVSRLAIEAAQRLQDFRPLVVERVRDDLEMSISLLTGAAQAALLLLDSNLRIWAAERPLLTEFEPVLDQLITDIAALTPVKRIRDGRP